MQLEVPPSNDRRRRKSEPNVASKNTRFLSGREDASRSDSSLEKFLPSRRTPLASAKVAAAAKKEKKKKKKFTPPWQAPPSSASPDDVPHGFDATVGAALFDAQKVDVSSTTDAQNQFHGIKQKDIAEWNPLQRKASLPIGRVDHVNEHNVPGTFKNAKSKTQHDVKQLLDQQRQIHQANIIGDGQPEKQLQGAQHDLTLTERTEAEFAAFSRDLEAERERSTKLEHQVESLLNELSQRPDAELWRLRVDTERDHRSQLELVLASTQLKLDQTLALVASAPVVATESKLPVCVECQKQVVDHVLLPCSHACHCNVCVRYVSQCPVCHSDIVSIQEIKLVPIP